MKKTDINFTGQNWHQGDVQGHGITGIPECWALTTEKTFFAKSEKSGHAHALCGDYELYTHPTDQGFIVKVGTDGATLNHTGYQNLTPEYWNRNQILPVADHQPTVLKEGIYHVGIQKRNNPFSKVWEQVKD